MAKKENKQNTTIQQANTVLKEWKKIKWLSPKELAENSRDCLIVIACSIGLLTGYDFIISLVMKLFAK